ncbi:serine/threonine protein kinase [Saccharomycopsis crataegensis]|uniref:Serine/threonine protein kinase n=1 Tax=Saccharomycopsis crataegensis TaxID=43959 RepID=A0AAV5QIH7_9ASCO|nr:serine/threonine protein kinase [Saccharomycopsis crataegensis]
MLNNLKNFIKQKKNNKQSGLNPIESNNSGAAVDTISSSMELSNPFSVSDSEANHKISAVTGSNNSQSNNDKIEDISYNFASIDLQKNDAANDTKARISKSEYTTPNIDNSTDHQRSSSLKIKPDKYQTLLEHYYQYYEKLGEGAFSEVLRGKNVQSGEDVAIKIISKKKLDTSQQQSVFKEVTILRRLDHKNIVSFDNFLEDDNYYYIIQDLCDGGEIFNQIVNLTYFSEDLSRHVICQVAESIRYLHNEVGVVHRDLKPENLLFDPIDFTPSKDFPSKLRKSDDIKSKKDEGEFNYGVGGGCIGTVKLADFGLSKQIWESKTKTPCGTVGYTAPEIVKDERYSKKVDMWALGCVLYTLLCGFPPFYDEKIDELTEKISKGQYEFLRPWWDEISAGAKNCVLNLLCVNSHQRYDINQFFEDPWIKSFLDKLPQDANNNYIYSGYDAVVAQEKAEALAKKKQEEDRIKVKRAFYYSGAYSPALASPAAMLMKDAFDVSTAVHRQKEERLLRDTLTRGNFDVLEEEEEDEDGGDKIFTEDRTTNGNIFELNLDKASIIQRRKHEVAA